MTTEPPNFLEYSLALQRLRRRAHLRRAVMTRGMNTSIEMPMLDEEEIRDRHLCQLWQEQHGFASHSF